MNSIANENFKKALYDALIHEYVTVMRTADDTVHEFSPKFESKMRKLIKRRNKPYYSIINTFGKRVACVAVIILLASSITVMSVEALRNAVADFFVSIYEKFSTIQFINEDTHVPLTLEDTYGIVYDLGEYEIINEEKTDTSYWITYNKDDIIIEFQQYTKNDYDKNINTENTMITTIDINGHEAVYFIDNQNYHHIIFDNDYYIIDIMSNVDKSVFLDIVESVQKVEER